jgi:hypothetical protein
VEIRHDNSLPERTYGKKKKYLHRARRAVRVAVQSGVRRRVPIMLACAIRSLRSLRSQRRRLARSLIRYRSSC